MDYFYVNLFSANLESPQRDYVLSKREGRSVNTRTVLKMLSSKKAQKDLEAAFLVLCLSHKVVAFKEQGQEEPSFTLYERYINNITFGREIPTRAELEARIKERYPDYEIQEYIKHSKNDAWFVHGIDDKTKVIQLAAKDSLVVLHPETFRQVYPELPENQGKISPVFDKYLTPMNFNAVTPARMAAYLKNCKVYY